MAVDVLAMQGARALAAMVLTYLSCHIPTTAPEGLTGLKVRNATILAALTQFQPDSGLVDKSENVILRAY